MDAIGGVRSISRNDQESPPSTSLRTSRCCSSAARPARRATSFPSSMCPPSMRRDALGRRNMRAEIEGFPEVSEVEAIRHFTRLSTWNYAIDLGPVSAGLLHHEVQPAHQ